MEAVMIVFQSLFQGLQWFYDTCIAGTIDLGYFQINAGLFISATAITIVCVVSGLKSILGLIF